MDTSGTILLALAFLDPRGRRQRAVVAVEDEAHARAEMRRCGLHALEIEPAAAGAESGDLDQFMDPDSPLVVGEDPLDAAETKATRDDIVALILAEGTPNADAIESMRILAARALKNEPEAIEHLPKWIVEEMRAIDEAPNSDTIVAIVRATNHKRAKLAKAVLAGDATALDALAPEEWCFVRGDFAGTQRNAELLHTREHGFLLAAREKDHLHTEVIGHVSELFDAKHDGFLTTYLMIERTDGKQFRLRYDRTASIFAADHIAKMIRDLIKESEEAAK